MSSLSRTEIARRRYAELISVEDKLALIKAALLGDELVDLLPELIEMGACTFKLYNRPCTRFSVATSDNEQGGLNLWLEIKLGDDKDNPSDELSVDYAGLMYQYADTKIAANYTERIIRKKFGDNFLDYSGALQVPFTEADVWALRDHFESCALRNRVELSAFYHTLKGSASVGMALKLVPGHNGSTFHTSAEEQLVPVARYFKSLGISRIEIDETIEWLFRDPDTLSSLEKIVALAAIHEGSGTMTRSDLLRRVFSHIVKLHLHSAGTSTPTKHLRWLFDNGMHKVSRSHELPDDVQQVLTDALSEGKLAPVHQFLTRFAEGRKEDIGRREADDARSAVSELLPAAFNYAMDAGRYGVAAAIAQIMPEENSEGDRLRALELAIAHNQVITVQWDHILL